jgi:predicted AAA+ superfamily ATPase
MKHIARLYEAILSEHLEMNRQMAFVSGPRQVGKTTTSKRFCTAYQNWDAKRFSRAVLSGEDAVAELTGLRTLGEKTPVLVFDEIHKFSKWKSFLKGFFDVYGDEAKIIVTGSARLDVFRKGGDSLMGRYFRYRMHPFSVGEIVDPTVSKTEVKPQKNIDDGDWNALFEFGGFPEPFAKRDAEFARKWRGLRRSQLIREDIRDMTKVFEVEQMGLLATLLENRSGEQLVYASLGRDIQISENTVRNWVSILSSLYFGFCVKPWFKNIENAIRKTPKWYLYDWAGIEDTGKRNETFVACHLLKSVEGWNDMGLGVFDLFYIRDKQKHEVDFLISRDAKPWFLLEVKTSETHLSPSLERMQAATGAKHAFQVVIDIPFTDASCFGKTKPVIVPARTFLSQLL